MAPEEEGEEGGGSEEEIKQEEVRLTAREEMRLSVGSEGGVSQGPGKVGSGEQGRCEGHISVAWGSMLPQVD